MSNARSLRSRQVDGATELGRQDRQRLGLPMLAGEASQVGLAGGVVAKEQHGGLGEGPLELDVADLGAARAALLAGRAVITLDQPGVGEEVLDAGSGRCRGSRRGS